MHDHEEPEEPETERDALHRRPPIAYDGFS